MTIIIPNHNEPATTIQFLTRTLAEMFPDAQVIVVNDYEGKGKGWALRQGLARSTGFPYVFIDGDLDIQPYEIRKLLPHLGFYDIVVGKKNLPRGLKRKLITWLSRIYIRLLFGLKVDTQTGVKVFNYKPDWTTDGWAFDMEILYKAKKMGKTMIDIPVVANVSDSKTLKDIWTTLLDTLKIRFLL